MHGGLISIFCFGIIYHLKTIQGYSWGRDKPNCIPINLLCAYTQDCCAGVCIHRVYFHVLKIKQCTVDKHYLRLLQQQRFNVSLKEEIRPIDDYNRLFLAGLQQDTTRLYEENNKSTIENTQYYNVPGLNRSDVKSNNLNNENTFNVPERKEHLKRNPVKRKTLTLFLHKLWDKIKLKVQELFR